METQQLDNEKLIQDVINSILLPITNKFDQKRQKTHGFSHMTQVAEITKKILETVNTLNKDEKLIAVIGALLHDTYDHKYGDEQTNKAIVKDHLQKLSLQNQQIDLIINIIDRISFSKSKNLTREERVKQWESIIGSQGIIIRDIISDADKITAIGVEGVYRCFLYQQEHSPEQANDIIFLNKEVIQHYYDKLKILRDREIVTQEAKQISLNLQIEMDNLISDLEKNQDNLDYLLNIYKNHFSINK